MAAAVLTIAGPRKHDRCDGDDHGGHATRKPTGVESSACVVLGTSWSVTPKLTALAETGAVKFGIKPLGVHRPSCMRASGSK